MIFLPFWVTLSLVIGGIFMFKNYIEGIIIMLILDSLYGTGESRYFNLQYAFFYLLIIILLISEFVKKRLLSK